MKSFLLSISVLLVLSISAQGDFATNAELAGNLQVNDGKGFELNFNTHPDLDQAAINQQGHYDTFWKENAQYSFDSYQHGNGYLKVSFEAHKNDSSKHLNFGAPRGAAAMSAATPSSQDRRSFPVPASTSRAEPILITSREAPDTAAAAEVPSPPVAPERPAAPSEVRAAKARPPPCGRPRPRRHRRGAWP